jgi:protein involved in polysaccharide export with SLBB domain
MATSLIQSASAQTSTQSQTDQAAQGIQLDQQIQQPPGSTNGATPPAQTPNTAVTAPLTTQQPVFVQGPNGSQQQQQPRQNLGTMANGTPQSPAPPSEFETYVERALGRKIPRFGASLLLPDARGFELPSTATVPSDYVINPGDELTISTTGSLEATVDVAVDSDGRIFIPRVGAIRVGGVRYGALPAFLNAQVGKQFRDFRLSVSVARLHGIRVYVTGFANHPGAYTVSNLSTLFNVVLAAGGPSGGGSYRSIELRRGGALVSNFDLYDLLLRGDRTKDSVVQNEDVIFIPPVGPQVAVTGSVNSEAIYEAAQEDNLGALMRDAGGSGILADDSRIIVSKLSDLDGMVWTKLDLPQAEQHLVHGGDILRILSIADYARPIEREGILVKIEGEVERPGNYYLPPGSTMAELTALAGRPTSKAFVYGTEFDRASVQRQQEKSFEDAVSQMDLSISAGPLLSKYVTADDVKAAHDVVTQLRARHPDGRVILDLKSDTKALPSAMALENNDRIYIPPRPTTVGVFGAVYRTGSFQLRRNANISDYIDLAGGPTEIARESDIFVVRADGEVISPDNDPTDAEALPGDVVFVPSRSHPDTLLDNIEEITSILFQTGVAGAAVVAVTR